MDIEVTIKAAVHIHSNWSHDGKWTLPRIADFFSKLGYRVVLTSEHDTTFDSNRWQMYQEACHAASTDKILLVPGIEYSDESNTIHILVWGIESFLGKQQSTGTILQKVNESNGVCVLAHPSRRNAWKQIDTAWLPLLHGLEFWNRKADGIAPSREAINLLKSNTKLNLFVGLDFHRPNQLFPLSMMIRTNGPLSLDNVYNSLRNGNYQSLVLGLPAIYFKSNPFFSCTMMAELLRETAAKQLKHWKTK
jgi:hypothetical protein